jgi:hypothetical protein
MTDILTCVAMLWFTRMIIDTENDFTARTLKYYSSMSLSYNPPVHNFLNYWIS